MSTLSRSLAVKERRGWGLKPKEEVGFKKVFEDKRKTSMFIGREERASSNRLGLPTLSLKKPVP